ncbi:hypothetical protein MKW98_010452 [Papaver atlanticum]|uniref:Uncharacterized protein n=1 Tax=Papaver atlanticum TaxID=357466 RepID=A0AAD4TB15_9MAGN|nr:hypothetical protein MKW98_010452 [Papaver atlanticum]
MTKSSRDIPEHLYPLLKRKLATRNDNSPVALELHWAFCYATLQKDFYIFELLIQKYLGPELRNAVCAFYLVLRALDTVEDDMNIPSDIKVPILENFHRHIYDGNLQFSAGKGHEKDLIDQFGHVSTALLELQKSYQEKIEETTKRMGGGMAKYVLKEVETVDDFNEYCHIVNGIVFQEMSKLFHSSNLANLSPDYLPNSMGLFLQKVHDITDFMEDMKEIPRPHIHWPRQIWSKYVDELEDLTYKKNSEKAVCCLNDMVTDALSHAEDCLEYISFLQDSTIFRPYAVLQIINFGTLALCYNNIEVFGGGVKLSLGLCAKIVEETKAISDVYGAFYDFSSMLKTKVDNNDPNATATLSRLEAIQEVCKNSGLLNERSLYLEGERYQVLRGGISLVEQQVDPFSLVSDELSLIGDRLRDMAAIDEVPKLSLAAEYFFELGVEGKRFRSTVLLLMASALNGSLPWSVPDVVTNISNDLRRRQQRMAEITEMIHVASLLHDDVLDDADTRRGVASVNYCMGNKLSVLAGDFLLSRACVALASLNNIEVVTLTATIIEHLVTGETIQMASTPEQRCSMDQYMKKTFYKTASLIANSCKAIALLADQSNEVAMVAYNYGRNLGLAFQLIDDILDFTGTSASLGKGSLSDIRHGIITAPILFAVEEFPQLREIIYRSFEDPVYVQLALDYLGKSSGIQRATELAIEHANLAASAIDSLPQSVDANVIKSRRALVDLTHIVITRTK